MVDVNFIMTPHEDKNPIYENLLWQGARPEQGDRASREGYDVIVLCDHEYQPARDKFIGVSVLNCPFEDSTSISLDMNMIRKTACRVAMRVEEKKKVLVTCYAGLNRSGLIVGCALRLITGWNGEKVIQHIQSKRRFALSNPLFCRTITEF